MSNIENPLIQMVAPANRESTQISMLVECLIICDQVLCKLNDCAKAHEQYVKENNINIEQ